MANKKDIVSAAQFAKKLKLSRERVSRAIADGILVKSVTKKKHGKSWRYFIDMADGLKEWNENIDPAKQRDQFKIDSTKSMHEGGENQSAASYQKARAMKEIFAAKNAELEYNEKIGKLVSVDRVKLESHKMARRVRDSLLAVPDKVAPELAHMDNPREISIFIKEKIAEALVDLEDIGNVAKVR